MASPHIAGLLAYFVSLQPASESAFAVDAITPAKLKKNMIAIASTGLLTNIPAGTVNLLAWNGGGSSNWTEIFAEENRNYGNNKPSTGDAFLDRFEELVEEEFKAVFDRTRSKFYS
jgi:cerevisin